MAGGGGGASAGGGGGGAGWAARAGLYGWGFAFRAGAKGTWAGGCTSWFVPADPVAGRGRVLVEESSDSDLAGAVEVAGSALVDVSVEGCAVAGVGVRPAWLVAGCTDAPRWVSDSTPESINSAVPAPPVNPTRASPASARVVAGSGPMEIRETAPDTPPPPAVIDSDDGGFPVVTRPDQLVRREH